MTNVKVTHDVRVMLEAAYKHIKDKDFDLGVAHSGNASLVNLKDHYPKLGLVKPHLMSKRQWNKGCIIMFAKTCIGIQSR